VERVLNELNGIQSVKVDLVGKKVTVGMDEKKVITDDIINAMEDIGYDVEATF
jgi:copper chaperone CopZ